MATSAQDRLNKLLPTRSKAPKNNTNDLHFSERELLEYKQRQQKAAEPPSEQANQHDGSSAEEDDFAQAQAPVKPNLTPNNNLPRGRSILQSQQGHVPGLEPDQVVFLPRGVWRGGLPATRTEDDGNESDCEPISSSNEPISRFCIWSLVAKFPYKYMQDPGSKVSRRFFASEKIYGRGWHV